MKTTKTLIAAGVATTFAAAGQAEAQQMGWTTLVDGLVVYQDDADLSGGTSFSAYRAFLRTGGIYRTEEASYGVLLSLGEFSYDFAGGVAPWSNIQDIRLSFPVRFSTGNANVFISPQLRWDYEDGVSASDGYTYGVFAGVTWQVSPTLEIGPAFGVFTELESNDLDVFPAFLVNWQMSPLWSLSTGTGLGASQGPGVSLSYQASESTSVSLSARSEKVRFRLDNTGLAPGGIGEDSSFPVVLSVDYKPSRRVSLNAFVGMELDGELTLKNATGAVVSRQTYDSALIAGFTFRVLF